MGRKGKEGNWRERGGRERKGRVCTLPPPPLQKFLQVLIRLKARVLLMSQDYVNFFKPWRRRRGGCHARTGQQAVHDIDRYLRTSSEHLGRHRVPSVRRQGSVRRCPRTLTRRRPRMLYIRRKYAEHCCDLIGFHELIGDQSEQCKFVEFWAKIHITTPITAAYYC